MRQDTIFLAQSVKNGSKFNDIYRIEKQIRIVILKFDNKLTFCQYNKVISNCRAGLSFVS